MTINYYSKEISGILSWKGLHYGQARLPNQIPSGTGKTSLKDRPKGSYSILSKPIPPRFYPSTTICDSFPARILPDRLSRHCAISAGLYRPANDIRPVQDSAFYDPSKSSSEAYKKRAFNSLIAVIFSDARAYGLIDKLPQASIDSTGLENHFFSRYFLIRQGKRTRRYRRWTKLTVVCHNASHLIAGVVVSIGPGTDSPYLPQAVTQAVGNIPIDQLLGDCGYDSEANHRLCREKLGIRSTVIAINERNRKTGSLKGRYRKQMANRFPKHQYNQRWQVESVVSRMKRRLGYALRARTDQSRITECLVRVLTYNLMLLYLLFQRAYRIAI